VAFTRAADFLVLAGSTSKSKLRKSHPGPGAGSRSIYFNELSILDWVDASTIAAFWRLARRQAVQLGLDLRDPSHLSLELLGDFHNLGRQSRQIAVGWCSGWSLRPLSSRASALFFVCEVSRPSCPRSSDRTAGGGAVTRERNGSCCYLTADRTVRRRPPRKEAASTRDPSASEVGLTGEPIPVCRPREPW